MEQLLQEIDELRAEISGCIGQARTLSVHVGRGTAGREVALSITKLQEAKHWLREASDLLQQEQKAGGQTNGT